MHLAVALVTLENSSSSVELTCVTDVQCTRFPLVQKYKEVGGQEQESGGKNAGIEEKVVHPEAGRGSEMRRGNGPRRQGYRTGASVMLCRMAQVRDDL